jgi:hypothetical protein
MDTEARLDKLEASIEKILELLELQSAINARLDNHITFIERVYRQLHAPLNYLKSGINRLMGTPSPEELEYKE